MGAPERLSERDLSEREVMTLADYLAVFGRRKAWFWGAASIILLITLGIAFGLHAKYRSTGTILIEQQEIPQDLVRSTVTSYADERIQVISQRVMSSSNLLGIIEKYGLYAKERQKDPTEVVLDGMRDDIGLNIISADVVDQRTGRATKATIAFSVSYDNISPSLAQQVANELTSLYLNENLKKRTQMAAETAKFLDTESRRLRDEIAGLEKSLADFKEKNAGKLPELAQLNVQLMDRAERELRDVDSQLQSLKQQRIHMRAQLAQLKPTNARLVSETGEQLLGPADQLKVLRTKYLGLRAVYAPGHPDVVKMRKEIEALEREVGVDPDTGEMRARLEDLRGQLAKARERYSAAHPDVKRLERRVAALKKELAAPPPRRPLAPTPSEPDNPAYIQVQAQLAAIETELQALEGRRGEIQAKLEDLESRLTAAPEVEREYRSLSRDYENALAKYQEIKAKQMEAQMAEVLESGRKGERFTLIEPPLLPEEPVSPNRVAILFLGFVAALAGGLGSAAIAESLDMTIHGAKGLRAVTGQTPLAVIPYISTAADRRRRAAKRVLLVALAFAGAALLLAMVHWLVVPLDVAWYASLRRLGL